MDDRDKADFLKLSPAEQKHLIKCLQLLERDGVIHPPVSPQFLALVQPDRDWRN